MDWRDVISLLQYARNTSLEKQGGTLISRAVSCGTVWLCWDVFVCPIRYRTQTELSANKKMRGTNGIRSRDLIGVRAPRCHLHQSINLNAGAARLCIMSVECGLWKLPWHFTDSVINPPCPAPPFFFSAFFSSG